MNIMKALYKCDYCEYTGTEDEVRKHESECIHNHNKRGCYTCKYKKGYFVIECTNGKEVPEGKYITYCPSYEVKENEPDKNGLDIFSDLLGF
jgi:hypothetical protein